MESLARWRLHRFAFVFVWFLEGVVLGAFWMLFEVSGRPLGSLGSFKAPFGLVWETFGLPSGPSGIPGVL